MPNNFSSSVKPLVLTRGKPCSLKRHFKGCLRHVVSYLDLLASKDPDRLVWASAKNIQEHCPRTWKSKKVYSTRMVERALQCLRDTGILSRQHAIELQVRRNFVVRNAYVLAPHDALTLYDKGCCRFAIGKVKGTRWATDGKGDFWFVGQGDNTVAAALVWEAGKGVIYNRNEEIFLKIKAVVEGNKEQV